MIHSLCCVEEEVYQNHRLKEDCEEYHIQESLYTAVECL